MSLIRRPWAQQPQVVVGINQNHWLADSIIFAHTGLPNGGIVRNHPGTRVSGSPVRSITDFYGGTVGAAGNGVASEIYALGLSTPDICTLACWFRSNAPNGAFASPMLGLGTGTATRASQTLQLSLNSEAQGVCADANGATVCTSVGQFSAGATKHAIYTSRASSSRELYVNGISVAVSTVNRPLGQATKVATITSAYDVAGGPLTYARGALAFSAVFLVLDRGLSDTEAARLYEDQLSNPWQLFTPFPRQPWSPSGAVIVPPTLLAASAVSIGDTFATPRVTFTRP